MHILNLVIRKTIDLACTKAAFFQELCYKELHVCTYMCMCGV